MNNLVMDPRFWAEPGGHAELMTNRSPHTGANFLCNKIPTIESCGVIYPTRRSLLDAFNLPQQLNYASYLL